MDDNDDRKAKENDKIYKKILILSPLTVSGPAQLILSRNYNTYPMLPV